MTVLDALREDIIFAVVLSNQRATLKTIDLVFDAFEAAHPGLIDRTTTCICCGIANNPYQPWNDEMLNRFMFCADCADRESTAEPCPKCGVEA